MDTAPATTGSMPPASGAGAATALVIPAPAAEALVRPRPADSRAGVQPRDRWPVAHLTLAAPFLPEDRIDAGVLAELERVFASVTPFGYALTELCEFPDGTLYLAPDPAAPFRRLTLEIHRLFPELSPHGVSLDDVVPHLTIPLPAGESVETVRTRLAGSLPLSAHAVEAILVHVEDEDTHVIASLPFGTSAA